MTVPGHDKHQGDPATVPTFTGGGRLMRFGVAAGVIGLAGTAAGFATNPKQALFSYLTAFLFVLALVLGGLSWLMIFHAARARWMVVLRRMLENIGAVVPVMLVAFIPIALGMKQLFLWADPARVAKLEGHLAHLIHHKHGYLNVPFFFVRVAIYFGVWLLLSQLQLAWSRKQDQTGELALTSKQRYLGAGSLPLLGMAITFAAFDWIMSLSPEWFSTIFGAYYIAEALLGSIAVLIIVTMLAHEAGLMGDVIRVSHWHSLGKLLFAFVCFWGYIGFSQFMLIYVSHLPEETGYFIVRNNTSWVRAGMFLILAHFVVPFIILLSRDVKTKPRYLALMAGWILFAIYVDIHWMVIPTLHPKALTMHWLDLTALLGVGGVALAFGVWRARNHPLVTVKDPYIRESARYDVP